LEAGGLRVVACWQGWSCLLAEERPALFVAPPVNIVIHHAVVCQSYDSPRGEHAVNYREATDRLLEKITTADLADELGVSQNAIARARLDPSTRDFRPPPAGWEAAVARVAEKRGIELLELSRKLKEES
jgi:hypothetical protein